MTATRSDAPGLAVAASIFLAWGGSLAALMQAPLTTPWVFLWGPLAVLWMSWLFTGLFITAHDAMHGAVAPRRPWLNHAVGAAALIAYAMFDYRMLRRAHGQHHARPAREGDPDWHDGRREGPLAWFVAFARRYLSLGQLVRLFVLFGVAQELIDTPHVLLFWALPSLTSVFQLFFFGTYLPHRRPEGGHASPHRAQSTPLPPALSLLTCFHFGGYHREHHENPSVPWWRLPSLRSTWRVASAAKPGLPRAASS